MHTSDLRAADLTIEIDGAPADQAALWPGWSRHDRLGVVVREPVGAIGASLLLFSAMSCFYAELRARGAALPRFAGHYLFHVGRRWGDHNMLDVWPARKEVVVTAAGEPLLGAIADRGITRLAFPDDRSRDRRDTVPSHALAEVRDNLVAAFAYAASGRAARADLQIRGTAQTEAWVKAVVRDSLAHGGPAQVDAAARRVALHEDGRPVEAYRRVALDEALSALVA